MLRFLGIGAQKSGTTWLYRRLLAHPQLGFPAGKELHFWDRISADTDVRSYFERFRHPHRHEGEITPAYAILQPDVIRQIHAGAPDLRLIYLLRNPVERAWSSAQMALARAEMEPQEASERWYLDHFRSQGSLARGDYARCIRNWRAVFARDQLLILPYESLLSDPGELLRRCCAHIGVAPPNELMLRDCQEREFEGGGPPLPEHLRGALIDLYRPRIRALEQELGQSFSHWLDGAESPAKKAPAWRRLLRRPADKDAPVEELRRSGLFDSPYYLEHYPDVAAAGGDPVRHYLEHGAAEGRDPGPQFSTAWYLKTYPDIAESGINPLLHYLRHGQAEGRQPLPPAPARAPARPASKPAPPQRSYQDFSSYARQSLFLLGFDAPLAEADLRVIGHMRGLQSHLAASTPPIDAAVTVIISGRDSQAVRAAIDSALAQSLPPERILIFHADGSPVPEAWLQGWGSRQIEAAQGGPAALPELVGTEYFACLRDTEQWEPDFLRLLAAQLQARPAQSAAYCAKRLGSGAQETQGLRYAEFSRALLENRPYIPPSTTLFRSALLKAVPLGQHWETAHWAWLLQATQSTAASSLPCLLVGGGADDPAIPAPAHDPALELKARLPEHAVPGLELMHATSARPEPAEPRPVVVIIPSFECLDYLRLCVDAVLAFSPPHAQLLVVDNASAAEVRAYLANAHANGRLRLIQNERNLGFTYAVNQGIAAAPQDADVVLLNNDAVVTPGWLEALQAVFDEVPEAGLAIPRQMLLPGTDTVAVHSPASDRAREAEVNLSRHHDNLLQPCIEDTSGLAELSFAPFFCVYIPRRTLQEIGPLDHENAPHYRSDRLYCEAVRRICRRPIIYTPHAKLYHFLQRATSELRGGDKRMFTDMFVRNDWRAISGPAPGRPAAGFYPRVPLSRLSEISGAVGEPRELIAAGGYQRPGRLNIAGYDCKMARALEALRGSRACTPPVLEYAIRGAVLVDQGIVLTPDGYALEESLSETTDLDTPWVRVTRDGVWLKQEPKGDNPGGLLLKKRGQTNYGHWLSELLIRLYAHQARSAERPDVIVHEPPPSQAFLRSMYRDSIALCCPGAGAVHELSHDAVRCERLLYVTGLSSHPVPKHPGGFPSWDAFLAWQSANPTHKHPLLRDMGAHMAAGVEHRDDGARLFLTRQDAAIGRRIVNAEEVEGFFRDEGFQVLDPSTLSIREQVALFAGASQIYGTLGAAFTNTLFAPPHCRIGYLAPVYMNGVFYMDLDSVMQRPAFNLFYCDHADRPGPWHLQSDIIVPMEEMISWYRAEE